MQKPLKPTENRLRVGLMAAATVEAPFAAAAIELAGTDGVELALWIDEPAGAAPAEPVDLAPLLAVAPRVSAGDAAAIREARLDLVLRAHPGPIAPAIAGAARHGVWAIRGTGIREVAAGEPAAEAALVRLTEHADSGTVLLRCAVATTPDSHRATRERLAWAGTFMPARAVRDLRNGVGGYVDAPPVRLAPDEASAASLRRRTRLVRLRAQLQLRPRVERWQVGVVRRPIASFLDPAFVPEIEWLAPSGPRGFLADPFLAGDRLLMEQWDEGQERGTIVEVELEAGLRGAPLRVALDTGGHLAYPYTFEYDGRILCAPESQERNGVFLYALDEEGRWREHAQLLDGVAAVDPTIVRHDGRWWLFHTDYYANPQEKLFLWSAPALLGPWTPHPGNPVKSDVRSSRPGGTPFAVDGVLYRPPRTRRSAMATRS